MLSQQDINQRLIKLRNYERLYPELKAKYQDSQQEIKLLKQRVALLEEEINTQKSINQKLQLQVEELRTMVFGKKKSNKPDDDLDDSSSKGGSSQSRHASSFRRKLPEESEIMLTTPHQITHCPTCSTPLTRVKDVIRYVEDMLLPQGMVNVFKRVEKLIITTGYCPACKTRVSAIPIPKQSVSLGSNVRRFVAYADTILRLTYEQTRSFLKDMVHLSISDGEISNILAEQARLLRPEQERLKELIRGQPGAHYDETSWRVRDGTQGNYAWVMTGTQTADAIFRLGMSRGKGNAEQLKAGSSRTQIGITDDYGAYRTLFVLHQLCWAHPHRKLRDLAQSETLDEEVRVHCRTIYQQFAALYGDIRHALTIPLTDRANLRHRFKERLHTIAEPHSSDPAKLLAIKNGLQRNADAYLTCLSHDGIPPDNNKAERALRHLVLKRKNSYGSKTQAGADTTSILASTLLSAWWRRPDNFFSEYARIIETR